MKYYLITTDYDFETNNINLYVRDENGRKHKKVITNFQPYFYTDPELSNEYKNDPRVSEIEETDFKFVDDKSQLSRVVTDKPKFVGEIRREGRIPCYEADILFPRRFLIDHNIYTGFEADEKKKTYYPHKVKPVDFRLKPRKFYFDIETRIKEKKVTIVCGYDTEKSLYISIAVDPKGKLTSRKSFSKNHVAFIVKTEAELLKMTSKLFDKIDPDIVTAWYIKFDKDYLDEQNKENKCYIPWQRSNILDLLEVYQKLYNKGSNKLKDVIKAENLNVPNYEPFKQEYWEKDLEKAIIVNKSHVEALVLLDERLKLIDFFWNLKDISGYEDINGTIHHGSIIDILLLRYYHKNKLALRSKPRGDELKNNITQAKGQKVGGRVFNPPYGIFNNIGVFDMSRYYPELIISQNLTFEPIEEGETGILSQLALDFIQERLKFDRELNNITPGSLEYKLMKERRDAVKFVLNTIFGYTGHEAGRCFNLNIFNSITLKGQEGLVFLKDKAKEDGTEFVYGDTDSCFLQMPDNEAVKDKVLSQHKDEVEELLKHPKINEDKVYTIIYSIHYTDILNNYLKEFTKINSLQRDLELKLDYLFSTILFKKVVEVIDGVEVTRGAKKRYAGRICYHGEPVNYLSIKGFEYVRKDTALITKDVQPKVFDLLLTDKIEECKSFVKERVITLQQDFIDGKITFDQLAIPKTLSHNPWEYGGEDKNGRLLTPPEYARGALYANEWLGESIRAGDQVKMIFIEKIPNYPKTDVICYTDIENVPKNITLNLEHQLDRILRMPLTKVFESVDILWDDIFHKQRCLL